VLASSWGPLDLITAFAELIRAISGDFVDSGLSLGAPSRKHAARRSPAAGAVASVPVRIGGEAQSGRRLMVGLLDNAKYWRSRAEEARVVAESLEDTQTKRIMLGIARDYERIAELVEQRVETGGLPAAPWPG
jgi:hypothetical protein